MLESWLVLVLGLEVGFVFSLELGFAVSMVRVQVLNFFFFGVRG